MRMNAGGACLLQSSQNKAAAEHMSCTRTACLLSVPAKGKYTIYRMMQGQQVAPCTVQEISDWASQNKLQA